MHLEGFCTHISTALSILQNALVQEEVPLYGEIRTMSK